jgi:hypothetical protein
MGSNILHTPFNLIVLETQIIVVTSTAYFCETYEFEAASPCQLARTFYDLKE